MFATKVITIVHIFFITPCKCSEFVSASNSTLELPYVYILSFTCKESVTGHRRAVLCDACERWQHHLLGASNPSLVSTTAFHYSSHMGT